MNSSGNEPLRRLPAKAGYAAVLVIAGWAVTGVWYVHHPRAWLEEHESRWPKALTAALYWIGNPVGDVTDGLGWTGTDVTADTSRPAPCGSVTFAGAPKRTASPAPDDIRILDRGAFLVGWSDRLRHPVWCAYHVTPEVKFKDGKRPRFLVDKSVRTSPRPDDYTHSGFDRGHMVPNHAIISRFGEDMRRRTFLMSNITPQRAALNRGVWKDVEHRIADLWSARYGEIWIVVGCIPSDCGATIGTTGIDVPSAFYQLVIAQEGREIRALAVLLPQTADWDDWAARYLVSIDELERLTGLDFNSELADDLEASLEAGIPTRLWPVRFVDILDQIGLRFN